MLDASSVRRRADHSNADVPGVKVNLLVRGRKASGPESAPQVHVLVLLLGRVVVIRGSLFRNHAWAGSVVVVPHGHRALLGEPPCSVCLLYLQNIRQH